MPTTPTIQSQKFTNKIQPPQSLQSKQNILDTLEKTENIAVKTPFSPTKYENDHTAKALAGQMHLLPSPPIVPSEMVDDVNKAIDEFEKRANCSLPRMLMRSQQKMLWALESYMQSRRNSAWEKKQEMFKNVDDQSSWMQWQGVWVVAGPLAAFLTAFIPGKLGTSLAKSGELLSSLAGQVPIKVIDSYLKPLSNEESLHLSLASADRQKLEELSRMPESIRNLLSAMLQAEQRAFSQIAN